MTSNLTDFKRRKDIILSLTITNYINNVSPVSSNWIAQNCNLDLSPATIRNILAELEEEGYLTHPHTSAGRVPTQVGYRYYVDNLMREIELLQEEKDRIRAEYEKHSTELEGLLEKTSKVLSEVTHYTSIISVDGWGNRIFCRGTDFIVGYPEQRDINKIKDILSALEEKEELLEIINSHLQEKIKIYIGHEITHVNIDSCSLVVSRYKFKKGPSGNIAVLGPTRMDYQRVVSAMDYFLEIIEEI